MGQWRKLNGVALLEPIKVEVKKALLREKALGYKMKICIGTDSVVRADTVEYATVIVFVREGKGGFMYISKNKAKNVISLKERMIIEVSKSIEIAYHIASMLDELNVELEVHADINTDSEFKSNVALKEAMGYILGMGFQFKAKPFAFASSSCADKLL